MIFAMHDFLLGPARLEMRVDIPLAEDLDDIVSQVVFQVVFIVLGLLLWARLVGFAAAVDGLFP